MRNYYAASELAEHDTIRVIPISARTVFLAFNSAFEPIHDYGFNMVKAANLDYINTHQEEYPHITCYTEPGYGTYAGVYAAVVDGTIARETDTYYIIPDPDTNASFAELSDFFVNNSVIDPDYLEQFERGYIHTAISAEVTHEIVARRLDIWPLNRETVAACLEEYESDYPLGTAYTIDGLNILFADDVIAYIIDKLITRKAEGNI